MVKSFLMITNSARFVDIWQSHIVFYRKEFILPSNLPNSCGTKRDKMWRRTVRITEDKQLSLSLGHFWKRLSQTLTNSYKVSGYSPQNVRVYRKSFGKQEVENDRKCIHVLLYLCIYPCAYHHHKSLSVIIYNYLSLSIIIIPHSLKIIKHIMSWSIMICPHIIVQNIDLSNLSIHPSTHPSIHRSI